MSLYANELNEFCTFYLLRRIVGVAMCKYIEQVLYIIQDEHTLEDPPFV